MSAPLVSVPVFLPFTTMISAVVICQRHHHFRFFRTVPNTILYPTGANPCEHFGKCVNTEGSFQCQCGRGYAGPRCEIDINECLSMPCQNDATCLDRIGEFTCICMPGIKTCSAVTLTLGDNTIPGIW